MKQTILSFCLLLTALIACDNKSEDASQVIILFENASNVQTASAGEIIKLKIKSFTSNESIEQFIITSFDSEKGDLKILDTIPHTQIFTLDFIYTVPAFNSDSIKQQLTFQAIDNRNQYQETSLVLTVRGGNIALTERSGLKLYSGNSGREDGFSLSAPSQTFICSLTDSAQIDVYAYADLDNPTEVLSREWRTNTDVEFIKNNTFDYVNATTSSIDNIYKSSLRSNYVKNIQRGDIILAGKKNKVWGVFHIVETYDDNGTLNDGYLINYKSTK